MTIYVDAPAIQYFVPSSTLEEASKYFKAAVAGSFKEAEERTLRLQSCDKNTLESFLYWLHRDHLPDKADDVSFETYEATLIRLWAFADHHLLPRLQNEVMNQIFEIMSGSIMQEETARVVFEATAAGSLLRQLVVREVMRDHYGEPSRMDVFAVIPGFMSAVIEELIEAKGDRAQIREMSAASLREYTVSEV